MKALLGVVLFALFFVLLVGFAISCAVDYQVAVFTYRKHPDFPRSEFLAGRLGVLQPTYARSYLYVAYRYLSGVGFNAAEREQVRLYWDDRLTGAWDDTGIDWIDRWQRARKRIPGIGDPPKSAPKPRANQTQETVYGYDPETYSWRLNCAGDAFRTAILTLQDRSARFGRNNPFVKDWLRAQDAVFSNCFSKGEFIPAVVPAGAPAWLKADRAYQLAAAQLYIGHVRQAESGFRQIAADSSSTWRWIAPYLVARVLARDAEAVTAKATAAARGAAYEKAQSQIETILADRNLSRIHGMSHALLRRVRARVRPQVAVRELARAVMQRGDEGSLRQDLWDYTSVLDHFLDRPWYEPKIAEFDKEAATLPRQDEVTDWIATFQSKAPWDTKHAVKRWRDTGRLPWLVAALSRVSGSDPAARDLMEASLSIAADSPAYWMGAYHRNRLRLETGDKAGARAELDSLLDHVPLNLGKSTMNEFRSLRMLAAPDLVDFLTLAQRAPVMVTSQMNDGEIPGFYADDSPRNDDKLPRWDPDSVKVLNERAPLTVWIAASLTDQVPAHMRQELVLATFARATLLNDDKSLLALATVVSSVFPDGRQYMTRLMAESSPEGRHFAAVFFLLRYPNVRPFLTSGVNWHDPSHSTMDFYLNNWWCEIDYPYTNRRLQWRPSGHPADVDLAASRSAFLQLSDIAQAKIEFAKLAATGTAPNYLGAETIKWAREHPSDPLIPEALSYVVRAGYYGCLDSQSWKFSRDAHVLLHSKYGNTPWARKAPYWYNNWSPYLYPRKP